MFGDKIQAVVLAAGKSKRFNTGKSKQVVHICGQAMILYPLKALENLKIASSVVIGKSAEEVKNEIEGASLKNIKFVVQEKLNGTGGAVLASRPSWDKDHILILNGDLPLITSDMIKSLCDTHIKNDSTISFFTSYVLDPHGYGRVIDFNGRVSIIEEKECNEEQCDVNCINAGIYLIKKDFLEKNIENLKKSDVTGEYYLTDIVKMASKQGYTIKTVNVPYDNVRGVNTLKDLWEVEQIQRSDFIDHWMSQGVRFELAQNIHIDINVKIGRGSFIGTGVHLLGDTRIGENCFISAFSIIEDTIVGNNTCVRSHSVIQESKLGDNVDVGPYARFRSNVVIEDGSSIGNFVEVKNSTIGKGTKAKHLSYIGDASVGSHVNIGAGTITCNHDGYKKNKTKIEDNAYIGSNNTLVAPVTISKEAYTAAGSTITRDVQAGDLAIARSRQMNKIGYAKKMREAKKNNAAKKLGAAKKSDKNFEGQFVGAVKAKSVFEKSV